MSEVACATARNTPGPGNQLANALRRARESAGVTRHDLARDIGIHPNTLGAHERGERLPDIEFLSTFAQRLSLNFTELLTLRLASSPDPITRGRAPGRRPQNTSQPVETGGTDENNRHRAAFVRPPLGVARIASGQRLRHARFVDSLAVKRAWASNTLGHDPDRLVLMQGEERSDSLLLVDTSVDSVRADGQYVLAPDGMLVVVRVQLLFAGGCRLHHDNAHVHPETLNDTQLAQTTVVGRVVWRGARP